MTQRLGDGETVRAIFLVEKSVWDNFRKHVAEQGSTVSATLRTLVEWELGQAILAKGAKK